MISRDVRIALTVAFFLCIATLQMYAATYYVSFVSGSDSANGTSTSTAWMHCPGDANATGSASAHTPVAGDTFIFKGGVEYDGTININRAGSAGNVITYDGNSAGSFGTGKAIVDGSNTRYYCFQAGTNINYIVINNFEIRNIPYNAGSVYESKAISWTGQSNHVTIENCYIHNIGHWQNDGSIPDPFTTGYGIFVVQPSYFLITGNEITKCGLVGCGSLLGAQYCEISYNNIHDYVNWGIDISSDYATATANWIHHNTLHDMYQYDGGDSGPNFWQGNTNPDYHPHQDFIFLRAGGAGPNPSPTGNIIEKNMLYNNYAFSGSDGTAMIFGSQFSTGANNIIRNNVLINPHSYPAIRGFPHDIIENNTIYNPRGWGVYFDWTTDGMETTVIKNNIMVVSAITVGTATSPANSKPVCNTNLLYCPTTAQFAVRASTYYTFAAWRGLGEDANSINIGSISAIMFVDTSGYPAASSTVNLSLNAGSPAIGAGVALSGFSDDFNGAARPAGLAWDIGAYEVQSAGPRSPAPPTGLRLK